MEKKMLSDEEAQNMMDRQQQQDHAKQQNDEQREHLLRAYVSSEGRERLKRIEQVKPERARAVETQIIQAVRGGKLPPPVGDDIVREILKAVVSGGGGEVFDNGPKITVMRKTSMDDDW
jgi:programmed cell death protein 5